MVLKTLRIDKRFARAQFLAADWLMWLASRRKAPRLIQGKGLDSQTVAVVLLYQKQLRPDTLNLIRALRRNRTSVMAVVTMNASSVMIEELAQHCSSIIDGVTYGRDFGGYKRAMELLAPLVAEKKVKRIIIWNDSVFVSRSGLQPLIDGLVDENWHFAGATESRGSYHHLGSFCLSFGESVLAAPSFWEYWRDYRPRNLRPHTIGQGEQRLSEMCFQIVRGRYNAIYSVDRLASAIAQSSLEAVIATRRRNPIHKWPGEEFSTVEEIKARHAAADCSLSLEHYGKDVFIRSSRLGSHVHQNAIAFRKFLKFPLVKLDLFFGACSARMIASVSSACIRQMSAKLWRGCCLSGVVPAATRANYEGGSDMALSEGKMVSVIGFESAAP